uniref:RNA-dependent polymerase n=1 Tax=Orion durna-like virus 1 TaxID=2980095 RepID=A0A977KPZ9_9VIRU|nr:MAG: RNA-dependent polymerase [Orion durna-like virus 1]
MDDYIAHLGSSMLALPPPEDPCGLRASAWFEDNILFNPEFTTAENLATYVVYFGNQCRALRLPQFPPGAKQYSEWPVCRRDDLPEPIWFDPMQSREGLVFFDKIALSKMLSSRTAPRERVAAIAETHSRSNFDPDKLISNYQAIADNAGPPQHKPPYDINFDVLEAAITRLATERWQMPKLRSCAPVDVPFNRAASAGVGYTGRKELNIGVALEKRERMMKSFLAGGPSVERTTPFGLLARLQVSLVDDSKHRNVAADSFHNYLEEGISAAPVYTALKHSSNPSSFGMTLERQIDVGNRLRHEHPHGRIELVADWPAFDTGRKIDDRFCSGVHSWEIRAAFMLIGSWFANDDVPAFLSLIFSMFHVVFKRVTYRRNMWYFSETIPSGTYWVYLLDSLINDLRCEYLSVLLGDPRSARIIGGDDSYSVLDVAGFDFAKSTEILMPWHTQLARPPKTQVKIVGSTTLLKFHGHYNLYDSPYREEDDIICSCILLERADVTDPLLSCGRLKAIWLDAGRRPAWLFSIWRQLEAEFSPSHPVEPQFAWTDSMWHSPSVLR